MGDIGQVGPPTREARDTPRTTYTPPNGVSFMIAGHAFRIVREPARAEDQEAWNAANRSRVGSMMVDGKRHVIVPEEVADRHTTDDARDPFDLLTQRELQIVTLVAAGRANKEIARRLHISEWTVSTHLRRIFAKLGVDSRAAMVFRCADVLERLSGLVARESDD